MSAAPEDLPEAAQLVALPLRREALLPSERGRGLGTVAVVCTMAGVASGLALATTLMAMQVADSMNARAPAYQIEISPIMPMQEHGYLGVVQTVDRTTHCMTVTQVNAGSPADHVGLQKDDIVLAIDGVAFRPANENEVVARFANETPGTMMTLTVERSHAILTLRPILAVRPSDKPFE